MNSVYCVCSRVLLVSCSCVVMSLLVPVLVPVYCIFAYSVPMKKKVIFAVDTIRCQLSSKRKNAIVKTIQQWDWVEKIDLLAHDCSFLWSTCVQTTSIRTQDCIHFKVWSVFSDVQRKRSFALKQWKVRRKCLLPKMLFCTSNKPIEIEKKGES